MQTRTQPDTRTAPIALWRIAEAFLHVLHDLFGAPEDVAARHTLTRAAHALMASWIRVGEALLLRLLMIEAAAIEMIEVTYTYGHRSLQAEPTSQSACMSPRSPRTFFADDPESWRVAFRCFSSPVYGGSVSARLVRRSPQGEGGSAMTKGGEAPSVAFGDTSPASGGGNRFRSAWPLAERYEAMLRVFNAPFAYARRLARRLRAQPQRIRDLLDAPPEYDHRVDCAGEITETAKRVWRSPDSS